MNFTREPIIETIITPKDSFKLLVRCSKDRGGEEYSVDAVEIVSFGNALFFRSSERSKPFLLPVTDFEIIEVKETRVVLKNASFDRSIKIGGGKEASLKTSKEKPEEPEKVDQILEKKRERRRHRRKKSVNQENTAESPATCEKTTIEGGDAEDEIQVSSSIVTRLIPPPPGLISDNYPKIDKEIVDSTEGDVLSNSLEENKKIDKEEKQPIRRRKKTESETLKSKSSENASQKKKKKIDSPDQKKTATKKAPEEKKDKPVSEKDSESLNENKGEVSRIATEQQNTVASTSFSLLDTTNSDPFKRSW